MLYGRRPSREALPDLRPKGNGDLFGSVPNAILMTARDAPPRRSLTSAGSRRSRGPSCIWHRRRRLPKGRGGCFVESVAEMLAGLTTKDGDLLGWSVNALPSSTTSRHPDTVSTRRRLRCSGLSSTDTAASPRSAKIAGTASWLKPRGRGASSVARRAGRGTRTERRDPREIRLSSSRCGLRLHRYVPRASPRPSPAWRDIRCADLAGLDLQDCGARRIGCRVFPGNGNPVLVIYP